MIFSFSDLDWERTLGKQVEESLVTKHKYHALWSGSPGTELITKNLYFVKTQHSILGPEQEHMTPRCSEASLRNYHIPII